jgi:methylmalonyl-CoA mutase N-terminal domain/subunit
VPAYDEAFAIPTEESARIGLRTQQIIGYESGIPRTADPLGGSYYVESLTDELQKRAWAMMEEIDRRGGLVSCIKSGYLQRLIEDRAFEREKQIQSGQKPVVGVNCFSSQGTEDLRLSEIDSGILERQKEGLARIKSKRDPGAVDEALRRLKEAALQSQNLMPVIIEAVKTYATIGEIAQRLREVYGEFKER